MLKQLSITETADYLKNKADTFIKDSGYRVSPYSVQPRLSGGYDITISIYRPIAQEPKDESQNEIGLQKYFVTYEPLQVYTTIGAKNVHHAFNKASKEFKGKYTHIWNHATWQRKDRTGFNAWEFLSVAEFSELLKKVKI